MVLSAYETPQLAATVFRNEMVGAEGFEPPTSCAQGRRPTRLANAPLKKLVDTWGLEPRSSECKSEILTIELPAHLKYIILGGPSETRTRNPHRDRVVH